MTAKVRLGDYPAAGQCDGYVVHDKTDEYARRYALTSGHASLFGWIAVVQAILILSKAYKNFKEADAASEKYLQGINNALAEIQSGINDLQNQVNWIINELKRMEERIVSNITAAQVNTEIGHAKYAADDLALWTDEVAMKDNMMQIAADVHTAGTSLSAILEHKKGIDLMLAIAPVLSTWLAGWLLLERAKKETNPTYQMKSPWQHPLVKRVKTIFLAMFDEIEKLDREYQTKVIPRLIKPIYVLVLEADGFLYRRNLQPPSQTPPSLNEHVLMEDGDYMYFCPRVIDGVVLDRAHLAVWRMFNATWVNVDPPINATDRAALQIFNNELALQDQIITFYQIAKVLCDKRSEVMEVFEPATGWLN